MITAPLMLEAKPKNFDECILENIESTSTDAAVRAVTRACRNLFPETDNENAKSPETTKQKPQYKIITLRINDKAWETNNFGQRIFRTFVTNTSDYEIFGYWDYETRIWIELRVVGCGEKIATRAEAKKIQRALNNRNFYVGKPDGKIGPKTVAALKKFQSSKGLNPTGKITKTTAKQLGVVLAEYDDSSKIRVGGTIPGNSINARESRYVDFMISEFIPDGECFYNSVKAKVQTN